MTVRDAPAPRERPALFGIVQRPVHTDQNGETSAPSTAEILAPYGLVLLAVAFNLFVFRAETHPAAAPNDISVHVSLVHWAEQRIRHGQLVFDGWYPRLGLGLAQFHHYQSLAPIVGGLIATIFGAARTVAWSNYVLVCLWPVCVYWSARVFGFHRWIAAAAAVMSPLAYSVTLYGFEQGSFQWRGNGIWTALWGMWLLPPTLALTWRTVSRGTGYAWAALSLGLLIPTHFLTAYLALLALGAWVLLRPTQLLRRAGRAAVVAVGGALIGSWSLVPLLLDNTWSARTQYNVGTFWSDSFGTRKVLGWLFSGELFDHTRWPVMSVLVAIGAVVCLWRARRDERARAIVAFTILSLVLFCGRSTFGFVINRLPGGKDLLLHRYIMGVHLGGIILAGVGLAWIGQECFVLARRHVPRVPSAAVVAAIVIAALVVLFPAWHERAHYNALDAQDINIQQTYDRTDGSNFRKLADEANTLGGGRIFAGSAATARSLTIGYVPSYVYLLDDDVDAVGFTLRLVSLSSDVEVRFDDTNPAHYNLFNVRYLITPADRPPSVRATLLDSAGRWRLYEVPTTGYLQVVDTTTAISADRTNIGARTASFLSSSMPAEGLIPTIAFAGAKAATPTAAFTPPAGSPGNVDVQYALPDDGTFGGQVSVNRDAVVMLKATYDPRWHVTVDGKPAKTQMLAPSFVGVAVGPGRHTIEFHYVPFRYYWLLFTIGALTFVALILLPRFGPRVRQRALDLVRR